MCAHSPRPMRVPHAHDYSAHAVCCSLSAGGVAGAQDSREAPRRQAPAPETPRECGGPRPAAPALALALAHVRRAASSAAALMPLALACVWVP